MPAVSDSTLWPSLAGALPSIRQQPPVSGATWVCTGLPAPATSAAVTAQDTEVSDDDERAPSHDEAVAAAVLLAKQTIPTPNPSPNLTTSTPLDPLDSKFEKKWLDTQNSAEKWKTKGAAATLPLPAPKGTAALPKPIPGGAATALPKPIPKTSQSNLDDEVETAPNYLVETLVMTPQTERAHALVEKLVTTPQDSETSAASPDPNPNPN